MEHPFPTPQEMLMLDRTQFDHETLEVERFRNSWMGWFLPRRVLQSLGILVTEGTQVFDRLEEKLAEAEKRIEVLVKLEESANSAKEACEKAYKEAYAEETVRLTDLLSASAIEAESFKEKLAAEKETTQKLRKELETSESARDTNKKDAEARIRILEARPTASVVQARGDYLVFDLVVDGTTTQIIATQSGLNRLVSDSEARRDKI